MPKRDHAKNVVYALGDTLFEWDAKKAEVNEGKHKVRFEEAVTVFLDERAIFIDDEDPSQDESRVIVLGISSSTRTLAVVHLERGERFRIISARAATKQERGDYESG